MRARVLFFGRLKDLTGIAQQDVEVPEGASLTNVFEIYVQHFPELLEFRASVAASLNQQYAAWDSPVSEGDEIAFLPPVSGGQASDSDIFRLVRVPIDTAAVVKQLRAPGDGALVVFDGFVRNSLQGRRTLYLEYEAYEGMAQTKMSEIGTQIHAKFPVDRVAIVHRLGRLEVGETSVLIAVSSPHRAAAFDACRFAIDTLKRAVPIWKREYFEGGAMWADGEFPS